MNNIEEKLDINVEESEKFEWGKSIKNMPLFIIKETKLLRKSSGKIPGLAVVQTSDRGAKFKEVRYVSADSITTSTKGKIYKRKI